MKTYEFEDSKGGQYRADCSQWSGNGKEWVIGITEKVADYHRHIGIERRKALPTPEQVMKMVQTKLKDRGVTVKIKAVVK